MKALIYQGIKQLSYEETNTPEPTGNDDNLIQIKAVGICGSDMHAYLGHDTRRPAPLILGHEAAGIVKQGPMKGQRVTINPLVSCDICTYCKSGRENLCQQRQIISMPPRQGAFAEMIIMPSKNLIPIPDKTPYHHAALAEPLAVCWHGVRLGREKSNSNDLQTQCLVIGGGAIGLGTALCLKAQGITDVTIAEPNPKRRSFLHENSPFKIINPTSDYPPKPYYNLIIDAVGTGQTRTDASALAAPGGVIVHIGLGDNAAGLDVRRLTLQEICFIGTYTYTVKDFQNTAQAIFDGTFETLDWYETRDLADGAQAFSDILAGKIATPKIILEPN